MQVRTGQDFHESEEKMAKLGSLVSLRDVKELEMALVSTRKVVKTNIHAFLSLRRTVHTLGSELFPFFSNKNSDSTGCSRCKEVR